MQVSSANSLTWLQSTSASSALTSQASSADGQDAPDGADTASAGSLLSSLQSPSQMFSPDSLNSLISAQTDQASASSPGGQVGGAGAARHHHHRGGGSSQALDPIDGQGSAAAEAPSAASTDTSAQIELAQLLMSA